jgi:hypothetical protein
MGAEVAADLDVATGLQMPEHGIKDGRIIKRERVLPMLEIAAAAL